MIPNPIPNLIAIYRTNNTSFAVPIIAFDRMGEPEVLDSRTNTLNDARRLPGFISLYTAELGPDDHQMYPTDTAGPR